MAFRFLVFFLLLSLPALAVTMKTLTINPTGDYTAGDQISTAIRIPNAADNSGGVITLGSGVLIEGTGTNGIYDIFFFDSAPSLASVDNTKLNVYTRELQDKFLARIPTVTASRSGILTGNSVVALTGAGQYLKPKAGSRDIWMVLGATTDMALGSSTITLKLFFDQKGAYQ